MPSASSEPQPTFERVYREQFEFVWRTVRALGVSEAALDDAVQDVFVVVHRRLPEFEGRASVRTWTYEIARRVALRHRTLAARHAARHDALPELPARDDLDGALDHAKATAVMREFLWTLDEDRRRAFVLSEFGEMPGREIAAVLDVNMNTIYARIRSARTELDRLAKRLHAHDEGAVRRAMRRQRPGPREAGRTLAGVLAVVGTPPGVLGAGIGSAWLGWLAGGLATAAIAAVAVTRTSPTAPEPKPAPPSVTQASLEPPPPVPTAVAETPPPPPAPAPVPEARPMRKPEPPPPSLSEELAGVRELRRVVRDDATEARARIAAYREAFPRGTLRTEVDALEVELACRTHAADAARRLDAFRDTDPDAPLLSRLEIVCAETIAPQKPSAPRTPPR